MGHDHRGGTRRRPHPLSWLAWGIALTAAVLAAPHPVVPICGLGATILLSLLRGGRRRALTWLAALAGLALALIRALLTAVASPSADLLSATLVPGLSTVTMAATLGLLGQAVPAGQWCDLAKAWCGRGAEVLAPMLCLGEAIVMCLHSVGRIPWSQLLSANKAVVRTWQHHSPTRPRTLWQVGLGGGTAVLTLIGLIGIAASGGLRLRQPEIEITGPQLALIAAVAWLALRVTAGGERIGPRPRVLDVAIWLAAMVAVPTAALSPRAAADLALGIPLWLMPIALSAALIPQRGSHV